LRKFAVILFLWSSLWGAKAHAQAANIYVTQTGATSGVCTTSVQIPSFFNNAANCGTGGAQIGSDTVVHLCGNFSSTDHLNPLLVFQGGGPAGHPITLLFETGADLTNTYWGLRGASAITTTGASHIVIDGNNVGIIEDTQNGTGLANHAGSSAVYVTIACSTSSVNDNGIFFTNCQNCTAQHNTITDTFAGIIDSGGALSSGGAETSRPVPSWILITSPMRSIGTEQVATTTVYLFSRNNPLVNSNLCDGDPGHTMVPLASQVYYYRN
jgi:hypothetical protein